MRENISCSQNEIKRERERKGEKATRLIKKKKRLIFRKIQEGKGSRKEREPEKKNRISTREKDRKRE